MMVILMLVVELPLAFVAVILYCVVILNTVGVPQIVPLFVPKLSPAGREGEIEQFAGAPMIPLLALSTW